MQKNASKMCQKRWRLGLRPRPHWGSLRRSPRPPCRRSPRPHPLQNARDARAEGASVLVPDSSKENLATLVRLEVVLQPLLMRRYIHSSFKLYTMA
jgi:hypothetical protein